MKILFIISSSSTNISFRHGLASISGYLKRYGHECKLFQVRDGNFICDTNNLEFIIKKSKPDIIGFSSFTHEYYYCRKIAINLKANYNIPLLIGGIHPTLVPFEVASDQIWDFVCVGDGEDVILQIAEFNGNKKKSISNTIVSTNDNYTINTLKPFFNLNTDYEIDYDLFDLRKFIDEQNGWVRVLSSRGCLKNCSYCANKSIMNVYKKYSEYSVNEAAKFYYRSYSINRVIQDIKKLQKKYSNITTVNFDDDIFTFNSKYVSQFSELYYNSSIKIPYVINSHVNHFNEDIANDLKNSGCMMIRFGVECGDEYTRKSVLNRHMKNQDIYQSFKIAHDTGIHTCAFIMLGIPFESKANFKKTIKMCVKLKVGRIRWSILYPYPGTAIFNLSIRNGLIDEDIQKKAKNYFEKSCFKFSQNEILLLDKINTFFHWYVNALSDLSSSNEYKRLVDNIDSMNEKEWLKRKTDMKRIDSELSSNFLHRGVPHYLLKYSSTTCVHSNYVMWEHEFLKKDIHSRYQNIISDTVPSE